MAVVAMPNHLSMFEPSSSSVPGSVLLCDVPFLEGTTEDFPFPANTADVPDDLMVCTPVHGWDTPPDSPVHVPMFEGVSDPLLANQVTASFYEAEQLHSNTEEWNGNCDMGSVFDWTPPASPIPTMDNDTFVKHEPYLNDLGMSFGDELAEQDATEQLEGEHASAKSGSKRKASSPVSEFERKKLKQKAETERMQRTEACEKAVAELASKNDEDPESRRHTHNVLERKRRNDLKNSYQLLRECLPSLEENERAPTGQILLHAVEYIASLDQGGTDLSALVAKAKLENQQLRAFRGMPVA